MALINMTLPVSCTMEMSMSIVALDPSRVHCGSARLQVHRSKARLTHSTTTVASYPPYP